eukprot:705274-Pelagomonas_calceolata.AAC.1
MGVIKLPAIQDNFSCNKVGMAVEAWALMDIVTGGTLMETWFHFGLLKLGGAKAFDHALEGQTLTICMPICTCTQGFFQDPCMVVKCSNGADEEQEQKGAGGRSTPA